MALQSQPHQKSDLDFYDKRQSQQALTIRRGLTLMRLALDETVAYEVPLPNGRRADLISLCAKGIIRCFEIKSSRQDFLADNKWTDYKGYCDAFAFATGPDVDQSLFPKQEGLFIADYDGALELRQPDIMALSSARRKAMLIRLVRIAHRQSLSRDYPQLSRSIHF